MTTRSCSPSRRRVVTACAAAAGAALALPGLAAARTAAAAPPAKSADPGVGDVAPAEDLMREHGVLNRILLIDEEGIRRLESGGESPDRVLQSAARIVQRFIDAYHEKLEEEHLFPRFEKAGRLVDLVHTLREQHDAGRRLTKRILEVTSGGPATAQRTELSDPLRSFIRMYRPHEAREDTVLFPAFRGIVSPADYDRLGDQFEDKEHELFGAHGFEEIVGEVAALEKDFGIDDLSRFTPR
jgi:hemerythrin-like domain-containing protein